MDDTKIYTKSLVDASLLRAARVDCASGCLGCSGCNGCGYGCRGECSGCGSGCASTCRGDCDGDCEAYCEDDCNGGCSRGCANTCTRNCAANCANDNTFSGSTGCLGQCASICSAGCSISCANTCTGNCSRDCTNACTGCLNNCTIDCANDCSKGCSTGCQGCGNNCTSACRSAATGLDATISPATINIKSSITISWTSPNPNAPIYYTINNATARQIGSVASGKYSYAPTVSEAPYPNYDNKESTIMIEKRTSAGNVSRVYRSIKVLYTPIMAPTVSLTKTTTSDIYINWTYPSGTYGIVDGFWIDLLNYNTNQVMKSYETGKTVFTYVIPSADIYNGTLYRARVRAFCRITELLDTYGLNGVWTYD